MNTPSQPDRGTPSGATEDRGRKPARARGRLAVLVAVVALAMFAVGVLPSAGDHGGPHPVLTPLARGTFSDDVAAQIRVKLDGRATNVVNMRDASDIIFAELLVPDGAAFPWHTHPGAVLLANTGPGTFTYVNASDCVLRDYGPGEAFVDPGQGNVHTGFNDSGEDLTMHLIFFDVTNGPLILADGPDDCDPFP